MATDRSDPLARLLSGIDGPVQPRPEFADALLGRLLAELERPAAPSSDVGSRPEEERMSTTGLGPTSLAPVPSLRGLAPGSAGRDRLRPGAALSLLATAALLLLTLAAGYVAIVRPLRDAQPEERTGSLPALIATPSPTLPPGVLGDDLLFHQVFAAIPPEATIAQVNLDTFPPGAVWEDGTAQTTGVGPKLFRVEKGAASVQADGPLAVTKAGAAAPTDVPAGMTVVLGPGDVASLPSGIPSRWRTVGGAPVVLLNAGITSLFSDPATNQVSVIADWSFPPAAGPIELTLRRVTLAPGAAVPVTPVAGLQDLGVESGAADVVWATPRLPATPAPPRRVWAGGWVALNGGERPAAELRNAGSDPAVLLVLKLAPASDSVASGPVSPTG